MARRSKQNATTADTESFVKGAKEIRTVDMPDFVHDTALPYAYSVIRDRALVDCRDGLKPVQRKILWTLYEDNVLPNKPYMKVARLAGNVLRYHPHGNTSVEDALVRMAQPYSLRTTFIDGKGSFGAHPGDQAAASRYIEAKLAPQALELLDGIKYGAVDMTKNFDETLLEPVVLPAKYPVAVINGSIGIAVGFASNMPQHNPTETLKACKLLLRRPNATIEQIMKVMPGPDFWTGGVVTGIDGIRDYFATGKGAFDVRAKYDIEYKQRGTARITFTELPPNVGGDDLVNSIRALIRADSDKDKDNKGKKTKKVGAVSDAEAKRRQTLFNGISRVDNLTGRQNDNDVRIILETRSGTNVKALLAELFKDTKLHVRFNVNNTVIDNGRPVVLGVKDLILRFLDFRRECVKRVAAKSIDIKNKRVHMIDGLLQVLLDIDKAIYIIRHSDNEDTARKKLIKTFRIDEDQANYVLDMPLKKLTRQDSVALKEERKKLQQEIKDQQKIIDGPNELNNVISDELDKEIKIIGAPRLMEISNMTLDEAKEADKDMAKAAKNADKDIPCYVYVTATGKIVRTTKKPKELSRGFQYGYGMKTSSKSRLGVILANGMETAADASFIVQETSMAMSKFVPTSSGTSVNLVLPDGDAMVFVVTAYGRIRKIKLSSNGKWTERLLLKLDKDDSIIAAFDITKAVKNCTVMMVTKQGHIIRFPIDDINACNPGAGGIAGMNLKDGDTVAGAVLARPDAVNLVSMTSRTIKTTDIKDIPIVNRGGKGVWLQRPTAKDPITDVAVDPVLRDGAKVLKAPRVTPRDGNFAVKPDKVTVSYPVPESI